MHQHRRRKKRPSYGVRTVEISRGKNGFGFTISGQAPCILSCIIIGSPAEKAGLRPGDFLIAVNGQNVSKAPHDDVVHFIGNSNGILKLQIAENYYSDSSEEEFVSVIKLRPKYPYKVRNRLQQNNNSVCRAEKVVQDLQTGALFIDHIHGNNGGIEIPQKSRDSKVSTIGFVGHSRSNKALLDLILQQRTEEVNCKNSVQGISGQNMCIPSISSATKLKQVTPKKKETKISKSHSHPEHLNLNMSSTSVAGEIFHSIFTEQDLNNILYPAIFASQNQHDEHKNKDKNAILKAVVGYLGTIEMPKEPQFPNSRLQTIRNCIRRLRIEKKVHTLVLMTVFPESIILINPQRVTLAEFSAEKISFSGVYSDDKKFFGLVTNHGSNNDELNEGIHEDEISISSSCHVFMVDPKLTPHHHHLKRAKSFHITCTLDPLTNKCKEFPESADCILQAVVGLYRNKLSMNTDVAHGLEFHENMSPQPSNTSSNSSNSDSGIGFRDEGNASDRVFIVDVDSYHQFSTNSLDRQAFTTSGYGLLECPHRPFSLSQDAPLLTSKSLTQFPSNENRAAASASPTCQFDRLTVRAMPDPVGFDRNTAYNSDHADTQLNSSLMRNSLHVTMPHNQNASTAQSGFHPNQLTSDSEENFQSNRNANVENSVNGLLSDSKMFKLSPKVYGLSFPLKNSDEMLTGSGGWECTSCSTDEMQPHSRHMMLQEGMYATEHEENGSQDVNPPTQEEDSESDISVMEQGLHVTNQWARTSSLRRHLGRKRSMHRGTHEAGTVSDGELASGKVSTSSSMMALDHVSDSSRHSSCASERPVDVGRVGSWAAGFNILLEDPAGLHTFSEFLKKEFSQENITFWIACERYRQLKDGAKRIQMAKEIYNTHLCIGAHEPVNVDSHARQVAQEGLDLPTPDLFLPAQKQIFNLMKFDCYQRFLKSSMFKECVLREMQGQPPIFQGQAHLTHSVDIMKSKVCREEKKRRSLIPWHKLSKTKSNESKNGGSRIWEKHYELRKSLKKKKEEYHKIDDTSSTHSDITGSRSSLTGSENGIGLKCKNISSRESLNSAELTLFPSRGTNDFYCRVILPDLSTTVVKTTKGETVGEMLLKLLERRSLIYNAVEAYLVNSHQPLDHGVDVTTLNCKEIRVEQVILFCLELPNMKRIGVKAKSNKMCGEILKPVLQKYGYKIDHVTTTVASLKKPVSIHAPITAVDNQRLVVEIKDKFSHLSGWSNEKNCIMGKDSRSDYTLPNLEELTNQIFEDLLKSRPELQFDSLGVIDLDGNIHNRGGTHCADMFPHECHDKGLTQVENKAKMTSNIKHGFTDGQIQNKALLPHNPSSDNNIDFPETCVIPCNQSAHASDLEFDIALTDPSLLGKENFPVNNKNDIMELKFENLDAKFGHSSLKKSDAVFRSDSVCSTLQPAEDFLSNCYSNYDSADTGSSHRFLQRLGIVPSAPCSRKPPKMSLSPSVSSLGAPPRIPPRNRTFKNMSSSCKDLAPSDVQSSSPTIDMDSTLTIDNNFDLDLDVDVTLRVQSASDDSLSQISFSMSPSQKPEIEKADSLSKEIYQTNMESGFLQIPLCKMACEPPPVPPKASSRGPPPRPPSRQFLNPAFCGTSEDDVSDVEDGTKNNFVDLGKEYGDFNISFV